MYGYTVGLKRGGGGGEKGRKWEKNGKLARGSWPRFFKDGKNCVPREKSKQLVEIIKRLVTVIELKLS